MRSAGLCLLLMVSLLALALLMAEFIRPARTRLPLGEGCNGRPICERLYTEVAYATTHNSFASSADKFVFPNHRTSMWRSLRAGVRGLMLDLHLFEGSLHLCHGDCAQGKIPLSTMVERLSTFLEENPREIVTILWEIGGGWKKEWIHQFAHDLEGSSLSPFLFRGDVRNTSLGEMVRSGERLVQMKDVSYLPPCGANLTLLSGEGTACPDWWAYTWDLSVETDWNSYSPSDFSCAFNRGRPENPLFILNHMLMVDLVSPLTTEAINWNPYLYARAAECGRVKFPNFITVDFWSYSNVISAADCLNGFGECAVFPWWVLPLVALALLLPLGLFCIFRRGGKKDYGRVLTEPAVL